MEIVVSKALSNVGLSYACTRFELTKIEDELVCAEASVAGIQDLEVWRVLDVTIAFPCANNNASD